MRPSDYNYEFSLDDGTLVVYNTFNRAFIEVDKDELDWLQHDLRNFSTEDLSLLYENGFVVDDEYDERAFLSYQFDRTRYATESFIITIAPTLNCNFACSYCYENSRAGMLDDKGFEAIVEFIKEQYGEAPFEKMQVNWYGGEPMLCINEIAEWSKRLIVFCEGLGVKYVSHMITNGSLVNRDNISLMVDSKITDVQITLDGWRERHDVRRPAKNGERQFDTIVAAAELMSDAGIEVSCRMNADGNNIGDYDKLVSHFNGRGNVHVHIGHLRDYEPLDPKEFECFSCAAFSLSEFDLFKRSDYSLVDLENIFSNRRVFCGACAENSYVIDERCNVYKCWNDIGKDEAVIFNLLEDPELRKVNYAALLSYLGWSPFSDDHCSTCVWMPICGGGCASEARILGVPFCYPPVYSIDEYLKLYFKEVNCDETCQESGKAEHV